MNTAQTLIMGITVMIFSLTVTTIVAADEMTIYDPQDDVNFLIPSSDRPFLDILEFTVTFEQDRYHVTIEIKGDNGEIDPPSYSYYKYAVLVDHSDRCSLFYHSDSSITSSPSCSNPSIEGTTVSFTVDEHRPDVGEFIKGYTHKCMSKNHINNKGVEISKIFII